jgi:hypothetical protein
MADNSGTSSPPSPERTIALWALVPGVPSVVVALAAGWIVRPGVGVSASLGVVVALVGFCCQVLALGWAREISPTANMAVALFGFLVFLGEIGGAFLVLKSTSDWFLPSAFGLGLLALIPVTVFVAYQTRRGRIAEVILDADRAATAARHGGPA